MKTVFSNSQLVHKFNEQSQFEGRSQNMFFEGNKIYSYGYHYLLGEFISPNQIIINDKGYSNTTSKHIAILRDATRDKEQFFTTQIDLNLVYETIKENYLKLARARKKEIYYNNISIAYNNFKKSVEVFGGCFYYSPSDSYQDRLRKVEIKKASKEQKEKLKYIEKTFVELGSPKQLEQLKKLSDKAKKEKQQRVKKFYQHKIDGITGLSNDLLRVSICGQFVETTQRVRIDIKEALRYYNLLKRGDNMRGQRIAQYTTLSFDNFLIIGCHKINKKEVLRIGEILNKYETYKTI